MNHPPSESPYRRLLAFISRRREALITLFGVLGLLLFLGFYDRAFPTAAIDLSLSRAEITSRAGAYMASRDHDLAAYETALTFGQATWGSYYLQQTLGIPETNRLIQETGLPIWTWQARWFRPLQQESFTLALDPQGRVVGFSHTIPEDALGAALSQEAARELAGDYLELHRGWDLSSWEEVSATSEERPGGRVDHAFSWREQAWDVGESQLRLSVTVQGDEIGAYDYWLRVPESFRRTFAEQRNVANFLNLVSFLGSVALATAIAMAALWHARWAFSASLSRATWPALAVSMVVLAAGLNELPLAKAWYATTQDYRIFWALRIFYIATDALTLGGGVLMLWMVGHWLSKHVWPRQDRILARRGDRLQHLARSGRRGLMLGWMSGGYVVIFYLVATQLLGGWSPMHSNVVRAYATPFPFLGALQSGLVPAMTEELLWRLILISGLLWLIRTFTRLPKGAGVAVALLVSGALWGFAHSSYVRDPITFRGIELTLAALLFYGFFFVTFDLTTVIVAHFVYNAGLGAMPLLRSGEPYFIASGVVVLLAMVAPILPFAIREVLRRVRGPRRGTTLENEVLPGKVRPRLRRAEPRHLEALAALPVSGVDWRALLDDSRGEVGGGVIFVLEAGDRLIGAAAGQLTKVDEAELLTVFVDPAWRRRYWGSELWVALRDALSDLGATTIRCHVKVEEKGARSFVVSQLWTETRLTYRWPPTPRGPRVRIDDL